jgi:putative hydrolase
MNYNPEEFERFLRELFESGEVSAEQLSMAAGMPIDPAQIAHMMQQFQAASATSGAVNWQYAQQRAESIAKSTSSQISIDRAEQVGQAFTIAALWLSEGTELAVDLEPKLLSRELWVKDTIPLFRELAEPVAESMGRELGENLSQILPEQFQEMSGAASTLMRGAGSAMFAMQLGEAIGNLSNEAIGAGEIGIPATSRPGLVVQNLEQFAGNLGLDLQEVTIYLALRELALGSLFARSSWLREQLVTQVREFAAGIKIDLTPIQELGEEFDAGNPENVQRMLEVGALISPRSEDQELALGRIELLLAQIEGWVEAVTAESTRRLPSREQISEAVRRRRAGGGAAEKTFQTLLGLELRPRLLREAASMWQRVAAELSPAARDGLWSHPDQLPSRDEVENPDALLARLGSAGDDWDSSLRDLLR